MALAFAGLLLALALGEGLVRWLVPKTPTEWQRVHWWRDFVRPSVEPLLLWELVPGADIEGSEPHGRVRYRINSLGMRGPETATPKAAGVFRVLAVGDSFTFGLEEREEDSFPRRLEQLARASGASGSSRVEVLNGGVPGYNTAQELAWLLSRGLATQPDLVILGAAANDVDPTMLRTWVGAVPPELWPDPRQSFLTSPSNPQGEEGLRDWLKAHIRLYDVLAFRWHFLLVSQGLREPAPLGPLAAYDSPEWAWLREQLVQMRSLLDERSIPLVMWLYASPSELADDRWAGVAALFRRFSQESGIPLVDLWPLFRARDWPPLFRPFFHLTGDGNQLVAEAVYRLQVDRHLLPP